MVMIALCSSLIGAVMGTRFRVQVLFPAAMLGLCDRGAVAVLKGSTISSAITAAIAMFGFAADRVSRRTFHPLLHGGVPGRIAPFAAFDRRPKLIRSASALISLM